MYANIQVNKCAPIFADEYQDLAQGNAAIGLWAVLGWRITQYSRLKDSHIEVKLNAARQASWDITPPPGKNHKVYPKISIECSCNITHFPNSFFDRMQNMKCVSCCIIVPPLPPRKVRDLKGGTHRMRRTLAITIKVMAEENAIQLNNPETVRRINSRLLWMTKAGKVASNLSMLDYYTEDWKLFPLNSLPPHFQRVAAELICPPHLFIFIRDDKISFH